MYFVSIYCTIKVESNEVGVLIIYSIGYCNKQINYMFKAEKNILIKYVKVNELNLCLNIYL